VKLLALCRRATPWHRTGHSTFAFDVLLLQSPAGAWPAPVKCCPTRQKMHRAAPSMQHRRNTLGWAEPLASRTPTFRFLQLSMAFTKRSTPRAVQPSHGRQHVHSPAPLHLHTAGRGRAAAATAHPHSPPAGCAQPCCATAPTSFVRCGVLCAGDVVLWCCATCW
jgi:hypothetical protein